MGESDLDPDARKVGQTTRLAWSVKGLPRGLRTAFAARLIQTVP
jgi:hypothetical protein